MGDIAESDDLMDLLDDVAESDEEEDEADIALEDMLKYTNVRDIAKLMRSEVLGDHLERLEAISGGELDDRRPLTDGEYALIVESNKFVMEIENEVRKVHKFIRDHYALKFPELESLVLNAIDYARCVKLLGNEMDTTNVDLSGVIPPHTIMVVNVTGSTTAGRPLTEDELVVVMEACEEALQLDEAKQLILEFVQSRMAVVAPNLSVIVGTAIASQLIGAAGGLSKLSKLPSNIVQRLGKAKKTLNGFSASTIFHGGFLLNCDLVKSQSDSKIRKRALGVVAGKVTLAARVDANTLPKFNSEVAGQDLRAEIEKKIAKWKEPPPPKQEKPLQAPDDRPKPKRGGKRARQAKERYRVTEVRKYANRMEFAGDGEDLVTQSGASSGMLGKMGSGLLRLRPETKTKSKRAKLLTESHKAHKSREVSGLSSSLVFTPVQGMELPATPAPQTPAGKDVGGSKYFSSTQGFKTPAPRPPKKQEFNF